MNTQKFERVDILGVQIACTDREGLFRTASDWANQNEKHTICYANAHTLNIAAKNGPLCNVMNQADLVYTDGISVVWAAKFLYNIHLEKMTARAWFYDFAAQAAQSGSKIFLLGGMEGVARRAAENLVAAQPGLQVVGFQTGVFSTGQSAGEELTLVEQINRAGPDILFVGLGTPLQEDWIFCNRQALKVPLCWAVGALFDYLAGSEKPVPAWMDRLGLEWLWRLGLDPRGKWERYLLGNPRFIWRVWRQKLAQDK